MSPKRFRLAKEALKSHYDLTAQDTGRQYHVDIKLKPFAFRIPSLTFYDGPHKADDLRVLGACYKSAWAPHLRVAFGDPEDAAVEWEDLDKTRVSTFEYRWSTYVSPSKGDGEGVAAGAVPGERRTFKWKRTKSVVIDGATPKAWSPRNWKLVEEEDPSVVLAVFTADPGMNRRGTLEIWRDLGDEFNMRVLFTLVCMYHRSTQGGG